MRLRGFTLIELVVVIAIISVLMALTVSCLRAAREQARTVVCASHLRQLLLGMANYEAADGTFPAGFEAPDINDHGRGGRYAGNPMMDMAGRWWFDHILEFNYATMDGLDVLICPSKRQGDFRLSMDLLCGNYGANLSICRVKDYIRLYKDGFYGMPLSISQLRRPSESLLVADSGYCLISWWHATEEPPVAIPADGPWLQYSAYVPGMSINRDKPLRSGQAEDAVGGRHPNKTVNVGLADGSVSVKRPADSLLVTKTEDAQWTNSPLWQPVPDRVVEPVTPAATSP
ncbi:MAG: DUF1559 domain-containing protein [Solirubrobacterales bacterium]